MNVKTLVKVILAVIGGLLVLKLIGGALGALFPYLFPLILMGLGYIGMKNNRTFIGGVMFAIGLIMLLGKLSGLIFFLTAVALVVWGFSMLLRKKKVY